VTGDQGLVGWAWFEGHGGAPVDPAETELCCAFARSFAGRDGRLIVDHLKRLMLDRRLPPSATDAELRHLEGQRSAVAHVLAMVERGRSLGPVLSSSTNSDT
jgi:hypothetical protein